MNPRKRAIIIVVGVATILQVVARHYPNPAGFRAALSLLATALLAAAPWIFSDMILDGETSLPRDTFIHPLMRLVAIGIVVVGIWQAIRDLGFL